MKVLLDTHILIWWLEDSPCLSRKVREIIMDPDNFIFVSVGTLWEISIKEQIGKLIVPQGIEREIANNNFQILPIEARHIKTLGNLPLHHKDPFDRILVSQALTEGFTLITHDTRQGAYGSKIILD